MLDEECGEGAWHQKGTSRLSNKWIFGIAGTLAACAVGLAVVILKPSAAAAELTGAQEKYLDGHHVTHVVHVHHYASHDGDSHAWSHLPDGDSHAWSHVSHSSLPDSASHWSSHVATDHSYAPAVVDSGSHWSSHVVTDPSYAPVVDGDYSGDLGYVDGQTVDSGSVVGGDYVPGATTVGDDFTPDGSVVSGGWSSDSPQFVDYPTTGSVHHVIHHVEHLHSADADDSGAYQPAWLDQGVATRSAGGAGSSGTGGSYYDDLGHSSGYSYGSSHGSGSYDGDVDGDAYGRHYSAHYYGGHYGSPGSSYHSSGSYGGSSGGSYGSHHFSGSYGHGEGSYHWSHGAGGHYGSSDGHFGGSWHHSSSSSSSDEHGVASCGVGHAHQCPADWKNPDNAGGYHCLHKLARQTSEKAYEKSGGACRPAGHGPFPDQDCQVQCRIGGRSVRKLKEPTKGLKISKGEAHGVKKIVH